MSPSGLPCKVIDTVACVGAPMPEESGLIQRPPSATNPSSRSPVLLIEPCHELLESRRLILGLLSQSVVAVSSSAELCGLLHHHTFSHVVIDTATKAPAVDEVKQATRITGEVRKSWPAAKILLLGPAPPGLEDHLYDDAVDACCNPAGLVAAARRLLSGDYRLIRDRLDEASSE